MPVYRTPEPAHFFEDDLTREALSSLGNPLERISRLVDFELFRPTLESSLLKSSRKSAAGRPRIDVVLLFKVLFLQRYYGLGDHQIQYQITDRISFRQFLGISTVTEIPDEKTVWACRNQLAACNAFDRLFRDFSDFLHSQGLSFREGKIIDATFVEAPRQHTTPEESRLIKEGLGDGLWADNPHRQSHKDTDARWAKKGNETHYGYKQHTKADKKTKLIESYVTTPANVEDSNVITPLLYASDAGQPLYLDAGYESREGCVMENKMIPVICEKGHRQHLLTEEQRRNNRRKSRTRCRVEHIFGFIEGAMHGSIVRSIGMVRARANTALTCLVYNTFRFGQIHRYQPALIKTKG